MGKRKQKKRSDGTRSQHLQMLFFRGLGMRHNKQISGFLTGAEISKWCEPVPVCPACSDWFVSCNSISERKISSDCGDSDAAKTIGGIAIKIKTNVSNEQNT